jgi:hypothetical protein
VIYQGIVAAAAGRFWPECAAALTMMCYALHWPQRQFPGRVDLCGFSHNIMHITIFFCYNTAYPYPYLWWMHVKHRQELTTKNALLVRGNKKIME